MRTYPRKDIQNRYPTLSNYIPMYPCRYPQKISKFLSQRVILLYPNIFFYIQNIYRNRYPIVYPIRISNRYAFISLKISIFDIHNDIHLIYPHNNPIVFYYIQYIYLFRYPYLYPSVISHCIHNYPSLSNTRYPKSISLMLSQLVIPKYLTGTAGPGEPGRLEGGTGPAILLPPNIARATNSFVGKCERQNRHCNAFSYIHSSRSEKSC